MYFPASKTQKSTPASQQKAAGNSFFKKAGEETFFGPAKQSTFFGSPVQAKLHVSTQDDPQEKQANAMADQVVQRLSNPDDTVQTKPVALTVAPLVQTPFAACKQEETLRVKDDEDKEISDDKALQRKPVFDSSNPPEDGKNIQLKCTNCGNEEKLQTKPEYTPQTAPQSIENRLALTKGSGTPLPETTRQQMEPSFGADFSAVRLHNDSTAVQLSRELGAQAFTNQNDIYFNEGKFSPESASGKNLLAHELTHTIQQGASSTKHIQPKPNTTGNSPSQSDDSILLKQEPGQTSPVDQNPSDNSSKDQTGKDNSQGVNAHSENDGSSTPSSGNPTNQDTNTQATPKSNAGKGSDPVTTEKPESGFKSNPADNSTPATNTPDPAQPVSEGKNSSSIDTGGESQTSTPAQSLSQGQDSSGGTSGEGQTSASPQSLTEGQTSKAEGAGGGFATYDAFVAFVELKKQNTAEYFKNKQKELADGIAEEKIKIKESIQTEIDRLVESKKTTLENIKLSFSNTQTSITKKRDDEVQKARDVADAELLKVDDVILQKKEAITSSGEEKAQRVIEKGADQSQLAIKTTEENIRQIDTIISQKSGQNRSKDNAAEIIDAALQSKQGTAQKIKEGGDIISSNVTEHSLKLAGNYREDAANIAAKFGDNRQDAVDNINKRRDETIKAIEESANKAVESLETETNKLTIEIENNVETQLATLRKLPEKAGLELDDVLKITQAKVVETETKTIADIDNFKTEVDKIYWYNDEVAEAQKDLDKAIEENQKDVTNYVESVISKISTAISTFTTEFKTTLDPIITALSDTAASYTNAADKLKAETIDAIDAISKKSETETTKVSENLGAGLQTKIIDTEAKWNDQLSADVTNMSQAVSKGLAEQNKMLNKFSANLDKEFNRESSWWDDVVDFLSGMIVGFWEGFTGLLSTLWDAMHTLIFWIIVAIIVIVILFLVFVVGVAFALILKVLLVIGIIVGVIAAIYYIYKAITTKGLSPYERGKLFGKGLFELAFALIGTGVYARLMGWIPRIGRIAQIISKVGSMSRFLRIVVRVKSVKAFITLIDTIADVEKLLLVMDKIKDLETLVKILSEADDAVRVMDALLAVEKADDLLVILSKADSIAQVLSIIEKGIKAGNAGQLITILSKTKELAKLILVIERSGDDFARVVNILEKTADLDKVIIALERVGAANLNKLIGLLEIVDDVAALLRIVTKVTDFATLLKILGKTTNLNKIVALFDKVNDLDKLVIAFDNFGDVDRLLTLFDTVAQFDKLVTVLGKSAGLNKLVPFLEGLTDLNKAIPALEKLGAELDDFVKFLDEPGMTIAKLEKLLHMENLTVAKLKNALVAAAGKVDDLINVLEQLKDFDLLIKCINHFANKFQDVLLIVEKAKTSGMTIIPEFMKECLSLGYKKVDKILEFFDMVVSQGGPSTATWREAMQYGSNFVSKSVGATTKINPRTTVGTGSVARKVFTLADNSKVTVTVESADIEHIANGHTWKYFAMRVGNADSPLVSMYDLGTELVDLENLAKAVLNSTEVETLLKSMALGEQKGVVALGNQAWVNIKGANGIISMYPKQGVSGTHIPKKLLKAAVLLWQSL